MAEHYGDDGLTAREIEVLQLGANDRTHAVTAKRGIIDV
jgi:hypothetical protein